jgi:hypothetical protein
MNEKRERARVLFIGRRERRTNNQREQTDRVAGRKDERELLSFTVVVVVVGVHLLPE